MTKNGNATIGKNVLWIISGGVTNSLLAFVGSIFIARFLNVTNYGILQLAITYFLFIQTLENIVHPNATKILMLKNAAREGDYVIASASILFFLNFLICIGLGLTYFYSSDSIFLYLAIMTVGQVFRASNGLAFKFDIHLESKKVQLSQSISFLIANLYRIISAWLNPTIIPQTVSIGLGSAINTLFLILHVDRRSASIPRMRLQPVKEIIRDSFPMLIVALITFLVYKADILILGYYKLDNEISFYSNAVKLSEPWTFLATAFTNSLMPGIIAARSSSLRLYYNRIRNLLGILIWFSLALAFFGTIFSRNIVLLTYGSAYLKSATILKVHIWSNIFLFIMSAQQLWEINESMQRLTVIKIIFAAIFNIIMNFIFIPYYGGMACAVISVVTYALIAIFLNFANRKTKYFNRQIFASLLTIKKMGTFIRTMRSTTLR